MDQAKRFYIPGLDGIRALAVLTVFLFHAELVPHIPGELATTVFFFLSGFLITTLFMREHQKTGDVSLGAFYRRRVLRILPPLYIVLAIALVAKVFGHVGEPLAPWMAAGNFLQYTNYALAFTQNTVGFLPGMVLLWSLAVDEHYYLLFAPAFRWAAKRLSFGTMATTILILCATALAWRLYLVHAAGGVSFRVSMASDTRMDSILWGSLLALWRNPALHAGKARSLARPLPVLIGVALVGLPSFSHNEWFKCTFGYTLQGLGLVPLFSAAILGSEKWPAKLLQSKFLWWISQISYPFYLISWLTLATCYKYVHAPKPAQFAIGFAAAFLFASAMHLGIERPIMRLRKRPRKVLASELVLAPA